MRTSRLLTSALVLAVALGSLGTTHGEADPCRLLVGADTPDDPTDDVEICREQMWFHQAETKAGNLATHEDYTLPTFDAVEPDTSVTSGAGGGFVGTSAYQETGEFDPAYTPTFVGAVDGAIDNVLVEFHLFPLFMMVDDPAGNPAGSPFEVDAWLLVNGQEVATHAGLITPREPAGNAVERIEFGFIDLHQSILDAGIVDDDGTYDVELRVVGKGLAGDVAIWVYDSTEVPSSITFNATAEEIEGVPGTIVWVP